MIRKTFGLIAFLLSANLAASAQTEAVPAFPGAEGFGRYTTGGRGGAVCHVTKITDCPEDALEEGTFRWACRQKGARTIVFDVDGTIQLTSELVLKDGDVTIAGQTAPGGGVCVAGYPFLIKADNVVIRFMRFRLGSENVAHHEGDGLGGTDQRNIIVDHCSVSWSIDECLSVYGCRDFTVQWCIVSHSLNNSGHSKGAHGYGGNWGGSGASYHHNLIAHHDSRTPRLGPRPGTQTDERMDLRNNVIYNWAGNGCYGGEGMKVNIVNNYYKPGPATELRNGTLQRRIASIGIRTTEYTKHGSERPNQWDVMWHVWGRFYVDGNVNSKYADVTEDNWTYGVYNQIDNNTVDSTYTEEVRRNMRLDAPIEFMYVTTHTAEEAYGKVLDYAGASLRRDAYDAVVVDDVRNGVARWTGKSGSHGGPGIIDSQTDVKYDDGTTGWPRLEKSTPRKDSDGDGMPDSWETANGLNPCDASDGRAVSPDGYTNLERYMNSLVETIVEKGNEGGVQKTSLPLHHID